MSLKRWIILVAAGAALGFAVGHASADDESASLFQTSYDSEAVGKIDDALGALEKLPSPRKDTYVAQLRRGWLLYRLGRHADAIGAYGRAVALEPGSIEARVGALAPAIALRRWADVESGAREVLKLDPGNYLANLRLAFAVYNLGRYPEAEGLYRRLSAAYPSDVDVRDGLAWSLIKMGKGVDAVKELHAVLDVAPKNGLALEGIRTLGGH
jgi:protein O-GlcNAc transferase